MHVGFLFKWNVRQYKILFQVILSILFLIIFPSSTSILLSFFLCVSLRQSKTRFNTHFDLTVFNFSIFLMNVLPIDFWVFDFGVVSFIRWSSEVCICQWVPIGCQPKWSGRYRFNHISNINKNKNKKLYSQTILILNSSSIKLHTKDLNSMRGKEWEKEKKKRKSKKQAAQIWIIVKFVQFATLSAPFHITSNKCRFSFCPKFAFLSLSVFLFLSFIFNI